MLCEWAVVSVVENVLAIEAYATSEVSYLHVAAISVVQAMVTGVTGQYASAHSCCPGVAPCIVQPRTDGIAVTPCNGWG